VNIATAGSRPNDGYLFGPRQAWFAYAMTIGLMLFDYIDRQVIVSLFPHLKSEWGLSDKQLGGLVSALSITLAACALPVSLVADRVSRVKSIVTMATAWSIASISCMFTRNYSALLVARAVVGVGEAGYGPVGAALIATHFPNRMRSALLGSFMAAASVGSVLGVALGGVIAAHWGWQAAFGVVGIPGLVVSLLYLKVRDYHTVDVGTQTQGAARSAAGFARAAFGALKRSPTLLWVGIGSAVQLIVLSAMWAWLPSFLNRVHGIAPEQAGLRAAIVVMCGAVGSVVWGIVCDIAAKRHPRGRVISMGVLCVVSTAVLGAAFGLPLLGVQLSNQAQFGLFALGGFFATCTAGPSAAVVLNVIHAGFRATGASILGLFQNLIGLAMGPLIAGALSDAFGLQTALAVTPVFGIVAAWMLLVGSRSYERDVEQAARPLFADASLPVPSLEFAAEGFRLRQEQRVGSAKTVIQS
jgi:MFS transporter, Spinster family, sphingosine-1-phosphate transporter